MTSTEIANSSRIMGKILPMAIRRFALVFTLQLCSLLMGSISAEQDFPPRLTHQPQSVRIKLDDPQAIECPIESEPASDVKWFKDGQVLTSEPAHLELMGAELMFTKFNQDDAGEYHCEAENYLGRVASDRFRLTVQSTLVQVEQAQKPVIMNIPMGAPIGNISGSPTPSGGNYANNQIRQSLTETLSDLYQIAKPTLILFAIMCLVAVIVLLQFLFIRRRAEAHRYMKHGHHLHHHHQYSSSGSSANSQAGNCGAGSGGSGASSALGDAYDPVLTSLLARTLSAPPTNSYAARKYKYYPYHMRGKVAAAVTSDHQLVLDGNQDDFISPYAVSSICLNQQQPPPVSSEAMRALKEQFDISQLVMIDKDNQQQASSQYTDLGLRLPFNLPPPPPSPPAPVFNCDQTMGSLADLSARNSNARVRARQ